MWTGLAFRAARNLLAPEHSPAGIRPTVKLRKINPQREEVTLPNVCDAEVLTSRQQRARYEGTLPVPVPSPGGTIRAKNREPPPPQGGKNESARPVCDGVNRAA
jgi:hypothetical protein